MMSNCIKSPQHSSTRIKYEKNIFNVSKRTKQSYSTALNNFENFCYQKTQDLEVIKKLKKIEDDELWAFLQKWIDSNSNLEPGSVKIFFSHIKKYLYFCGIKITNQEINDNLKFITANKKPLYLLTQKEIAQILNELSYRDKTLFLCQLSSGLGIGELVQLTKADLSYVNRRMIIKLNISKNNEKITVFSKEATDMVKPILRTKNKDDLIFGTNKNSHYSEINKEQVLRRALKRCCLNMTYPNSRRHKINTGSFRFFHFVTVSEYDYNFACYLRGCDNKINPIQIDKMSNEELLDKYFEVENKLTIYNQ
jgi:site-specific recombinase XerD